MSARDYNTQAPTVGFSNTLNRGHDDSDVNYLTAALSWYLGGPAGEDVKAAWDRILDRLGIPRETEQPTRAPDPAVAVLEAEVARLREALIEMVDEKCDYMRINRLGDPETQHSIKRAREALNPAPTEKEAG